MWIALRAGRGPGLLALICCVLAALAPWAAAQDAPKNVIVMISDGCGFMQVEAADRWRHGAPDMSLKPNFPVCIAMHTHSLEGPPYDAEAAWTSFDRPAHQITIGSCGGDERAVTAVEAVMNLSERAKERQAFASSQCPVQPATCGIVARTSPGQLRRDRPGDAAQEQDGRRKAVATLVMTKATGSMRYDTRWSAEPGPDRQRRDAPRPCG